jgi:release factor glutamine methyltransferase
MRKVAKYIVAKTYRPLLVKYLTKTRTYRYRNTVLEVPPQVFHPGFFFSTRLLLNYLDKLNLQGRSFLELGAGSGLIAIQAVRKGAAVTATDINPVAIKALHKNRLLNRTCFSIIQSDLFDRIPEQGFDVIAINPPYYKKDPVTPADHAWFCGAEGEYFSRLFTQIKIYTTAESVVLMILCDGCDFEMINKMAAANNITLRQVFTSKNLLERNFIYQLDQHS